MHSHTHSLLQCTAIWAALLPHSPKLNTNKASCLLESVGSLTFTWLLCKHSRELHKFQPRVSAPRCAEPDNSLQLKAEREAIRLTQHWVATDLLSQMVCNLSSGGNPIGFCGGMLLLHPRARLCEQGPRTQRCPSHHGRMFWAVPVWAPSEWGSTCWNSPCSRWALPWVHTEHHTLTKVLQQ